MYALTLIKNITKHRQLQYRMPIYKEKNVAKKPPPPKKKEQKGPP